MTYQAAIDSIESVGGSLTRPMSGTWVAEVDAIADERWSVGQGVVLTLLGVEWHGTVVQGNPLTDGRAHLRIIGGANKLNVVIKSSDYAGQTLSAVIRDVLTSGGESVGDLTLLDNVTLQHWTHAKETVAFCLNRLLRHVPAGTYLRVGRDGGWQAYTPTWVPSGLPYDEDRFDSYPAEGAAEIHLSEGRSPDAGEAITLLNETFEIDRVQYEWTETTYRGVLWRFDHSTFEDRLHAAQRTVTRLQAARDTSINFHGWYSGKVAKENTGNGLVDIFFNDELERITTLTQVRLFSDVGTQDTIKVGTNVAVGWLFGDERYPVALVGSWHGGGGLKSRTVDVQDNYLIRAGFTGLGGNPDQLDKPLTRRDMQSLLKALTSAIPVAGDGGAGLVASMMALLSVNPALGWSAGSTIEKLGSDAVGIKR